MNFGRVLTAMVTPFKKENVYQIDYVALEKLIDYLIENGTDALVISGTTGESPNLTKEEKLNLFQFVSSYVNKRVPVIAGTGSNNTYETISLTKEAEKTGIDAIMIVTPYYNKPSQEGLYVHFKEIANSTSLPVMLYNVPGRTVTRLEPKTIINLSKIDNIVSLKDAGGDLDKMSEVIEYTPETFTVYSGDDCLTLPSMSIGANGVVSVASHILGNDMKNMIELFSIGKVQEASTIHRKLVPKMNTLFMYPSPTPVKEALRLKGLDTGGVRLPLVNLNPEQINSLKENLK